MKHYKKIEQMPNMYLQSYLIGFFFGFFKRVEWQKVLINIYVNVQGHYTISIKPYQKKWESTKPDPAYELLKHLGHEKSGSSNPFQTHRPNC